MRAFYTIGIFLYGVAARIAALWSPQAKLLAQGWSHSFDGVSQLREEAFRQNKKIAWFHAASLGEFEQARPVIESFHRLHTEYLVCLTFFSPSGYEVRHNYDQTDLVTYMPLDTPGKARRWVETLKPSVAFFVKYEFWYNLLGQLQKNHIPTYLFSAIFRPNQYFFRPVVGRWFRCQLQCYSHIFVQNQDSMQLLTQKARLAHVSVAGDTRFDRVHDIALQAPARPEIEAFVGDSPVLLAGSSWEPDEENIHHFLQRYQGALKIILAPHIIGENHLKAIEQLFGPHTLRYTCLKRLAKEGNERALRQAASYRTLVIDNMGMLSSLYRYATVAYIGGGFGKGIHNILEAITFGKPVIFGPNHTKFKEAMDIIACGGGKSYRTDDELTAYLTAWLTDSDIYQQAATQSAQYAHANLGATTIILTTVQPRLL